jgi:crotonobetainyl-CoA:carnitine CoA-transferase CaiB-like acyl-CoA transferase
MGKEKESFATHAVELPLTGYRVIDLAYEGLLCGKILAELGADVIAVEPPAGNTARNRGPFYHDIPHPEKSLYWFAYSNNKRGITLNLESADGKEIFERLIGTTHFLIESFPPGYMDSLGLGYQDLSKVNFQLIMASITPFGQTGPYAHYKGSDIIPNAMGGMMHICGDTDRPPVRLSAEQASNMAGVSAAAACAIAHYYRETSGEGQYIDVSMQEAMAQPILFPIGRWDFQQLTMKRMGAYRQHKLTPLRLIYPCKDGYVCFWIGTSNLLGPSQAELINIMKAEGIGTELEDKDWVSLDMETLSKEDHDLYADLHIQYFMRHTRKELFEELIKKRGILLGPVNDPKDLVEDEQLEARDFWEYVKHQELNDTLRYPGCFYKSDQSTSHIKYRAPLLGEHNYEIYHKELGLSKDELVLLKETGII